MIKFLRKMNKLTRSIIMLVLVVCVIILIGMDNKVLQGLSLIPLALFLYLVFLERYFKNLEDEEKIRQEYKKAKMETKKFPFDDVENGYVLKWSYYNEPIAGTRYLNIDYSSLKCGEELTLVKDPNNPHDNNAIKVLYKDKQLGYIHKNYIQEMFNKYQDNPDFKIKTRLNTIDEKNKKLQLEIGFFKKFTVEEFKPTSIYKCYVHLANEHKDAWENVQEGDYVTIDLWDKIYVKKDDLILGELTFSECKNLYSLSYDFTFIARLCSISKQKNNIVGKVEIYVIKM